MKKWMLLLLLVNGVVLLGQAQIKIGKRTFDTKKY